MSNEEQKTDSAQLVQQMLLNIDQVPVVKVEDIPVAKQKKVKKKKDEKVEEEQVLNPVFNKYKVKDFVFLSIMAAVTFLSGGVMPLIGQIPVFGIIQLCLAFGFSFFITIGLLKVRKPGALLYMSALLGVFMAFMNFGMFFSIMLCAIATELLALVIFRKHYRSAACQVFQGTLYFPLTLPFMYIWYKFLYEETGKEGAALKAFMGSDAGPAIGISIAVLAITFVSSLLAYFLMKELKKAGVVKE